MIISENSVGFATLAADSRIILIRVGSVARSYSGPAECSKMFSTRMTAPSTMMPKSTAPIDRRFADMPRACR